MRESEVLAHLSSDEVTRARAFRSSADRHLYLACHLALRVRLAMALQVEPIDVPIVRGSCPACGGPHGRPQLPGAPLHFSLSHTDDLGLVAIGPAPIGVDVERLASPATVALVTPTLHPRERAEIAELPAPSRALAFTRAWVRTEAYLKGVGVGLCRSPGADYLGARALPDAPPPGWAIRDLPLSGKHIAALAEAR